jgi:hypothetical protein
LFFASDDGAHHDRRLALDLGEGDRRIARAYRLAFGREPSASECRGAQDFLHRQADGCGRADDENRYLIFDIVKFIYNEVPSSAWGSTKNVQGWLEHFGLQGIEHHMARKLEQALEQLEEEDHD